MNLTNKQKDLLLNLIIQEQRSMFAMNANIQKHLDEYKQELDKICKIICNSWESEEECQNI